MSVKKTLFSAVLFFVVGLSLAPAQNNASVLKLGIFADADSLPFMLCESEGLFAAEGLEVQLLRFQSAIERDSAFQAGAIDGVITDILAVMLAVQGGFPVKIASLTDGRYGIAVSPSVSAAGLSDLAGKTIGISSNTVIHYVVDSLLSRAGLRPSEINLLPVPKMPLRLEMMLTGQTAAAGMPEPFLTTASVRGARILAATDDYGFGAGVLAFSQKALDAKLGEVKKLYRAYWSAAQKINSKPEAYRPLLVTKAGFSEEAAKAYSFVVYKKPRLPSFEDMRSAADWLSAKGLLKTTPDFEALVDRRPLESF